MTKEKEQKKMDTEQNVQEKVDDVMIIAGTKEQRSQDAGEIVAISSVKSVAESADVLSDASLDLVIEKIAEVMNATAARKFKGSVFLEPSEVDEVKRVLAYQNCSKEVKNEFENELTGFQEQIKANYVNQIKEFNDKKTECESQIDMLETAKKELIMKRLAKFNWPYDKRTKAFDAKIATLKMQAARFEQKLTEVEAMRPAAKEKDIILFQMQLKQKFSL